MSLSIWGWNEALELSFGPLAPAEPARVISETQGIYRVATAAGEMQGLARRDARAVTGDWVAFDARQAVITRLLPRHSVISRKKAGREAEEQILAANVDVLFIVTALDSDFSAGRMERYLVVARQSGASPVLVLNKQDQCPDALAKLREADLLTSGAVPVVLMSALDPGSAGQLYRYVQPGQTATLLGSSGVGKSTIVNRLLGSAVQLTSAVRETDGKGRHTTTGRQLFPLSAGWLLMDTPGLREIEPWAEPSSVDDVFGDVVAAGAACRFRNCSHRDEPDCAIREAIQQGRIDPRRFENFQNLKGAMTELEKKRKTRVAHRAMRRMPDKRDFEESGLTD